MASQRYYLLNKFLIACIFIGVVMILIKEKEGFASHYNNINELYRGPILDKLEVAKEPRKIHNQQNNSIRVGKYSKISNNFGIHPCNDKNTKGNKMCENFYNATDVVMKKTPESCMPDIFDCRRVGFFCSLID
jgi:hypothetical protein